MGFSDARLAQARRHATRRRSRSGAAALSVHPVYKRIDTCAAEFASLTPYMYSCYEGDGIAAGRNARRIRATGDKVIILGGGPNRIGQGIEFDYCCVHAAYACTRPGIETIMVNCNPETVSTDYDTSDRLYFEPLTAEDVIEIVRVEQRRGTAARASSCSSAGRRPLKLAAGAGGGRHPDPRHLARRDRPRRGPRALPGAAARPRAAPAGQRHRLLGRRGRGDRRSAIGYPVVIRPSYVLGGRAMEIVHDTAGLNRYIRRAVIVSGTSPVLIDRYLQNAIEVDVDAVADGDDVYVAGIMEHIEEAGIHSGDSACSLPPYSLERRDDRRDRAADRRPRPRARRRRADERAVRGQGRRCLRARGQPARLAHGAVRRQGDRRADRQDRRAGHGRRDARATSRQREPAAHRAHVAVKEAVFPFARFPGVDLDPRAGDEIDRRGHGPRRRFRPRLRQVAARRRHRPAARRQRLRLGARPDKPALVEPCRRLVEMGFELVATRGTAADADAKRACRSTSVNKVREGRPHIVDAMLSGGVQLVFNTTEGSQAIADSFSLRRTALTNAIPYYTTVAGARAAVQAIAALRTGSLEVAPLPILPLIACRPARMRARRYGLTAGSERCSMMNKIPMTVDGYQSAPGGAEAAEDRRPAGHHPRHRRGARRTAIWRKTPNITRRASGRASSRAG